MILYIERTPTQFWKMSTLVTDSPTWFCDFLWEVNEYSEKSLISPLIQTYFSGRQKL